ncbi:sigma factor-like helix-turn-helix DNA-binding protein [Candidatus Poriferisodalis sp.]|uniref:sigma factor-like helix-turn-helix DNA-binding protein n=1 Tax=Candidatus Poriferisodalis sp. TaxID=3101277 RepID=UPI003B520261
MAELHITRIVAANGVSYGSPRRAAAWGTANCPLIPRPYRDAYGALEPPLVVLDHDHAETLTVADLGSEIWERLGLHELPQAIGRELRGWVGELSCPVVPDAIPAQLPLSWVAALPLRKRTRNAVRRLIEDNGHDGPLEAPRSSGQILALPGIGALALVDLLSVMESAELPGIQEASASASGVDNEQSAVSALAQHLRDFAAWAIAESDAKTFGQALAAAGLEEIDEWRSLSTFPLSDIGATSPHPYVVLSKWAEGLDDRERSIFADRIAQPRRPRTLQHLADELTISRERVRQIETRVVARLGLFVDSTAGSPIRWRATTLRDRLSVTAPRGHVNPMLDPPADCYDDYQSLLLELAGPYDESDGWLVLRSARSNDPTDAIRNMTDEFGRIDVAKASAALAGWGLDSGLHDDWIARDRKLRLVNGQVVRWDGPIADKLAFGLADLAEPATAEKLLAHIGESRAITSAKNAMAEDERFVRANRTEWALASWGLPEYSGIASTIGQILERSDSPMLVDELIDRLSRDFGIAEGSARSYCDAAMFVLEDGWIRLRREHEKYHYQNSEVRDAPGVFTLGDGVVGLLYEVDRDVTRGSGRQLSPAAGALLDLSVNERLRFDGPHGTSVTVTFPGTSFSGPSLGSTRGLAEAVNAKMGDMLTVILRRGEMTVSARATDLNEHGTGWAHLARLTGISEYAGMDGLAAALHCSRGEVRATLRARRDTAVLEALPERRSTPELEEALAALDAEMQREEPY